MRPERRLTVLVAVGVIALVAAVAEAISVPLPVRVVLGLPLVLVLPGFAAVCALLPGREFSWGERALGSLGASLAITVCISVLLAATPIGLSKGSAAAFLGVGTAAAALCAWVRTRHFLEAQDSRKHARSF